MLLLLLVPCCAGALLFLLLLHGVVISFSLLLWGKCCFWMLLREEMFCLFFGLGRAVQSLAGLPELQLQSRKTKKTHTAKNNIPPIQHKYFGSSRHQSINKSSVHGHDDQSNAGSGKTREVFFKNSMLVTACCLERPSLLATIILSLTEKLCS